MIRSFFLFTGVVSFLALVVGVGCDEPASAIDPALLTGHRAQFVLAEEPEGVMTVLDVREALLGESFETHDDHTDHDQDGPDHADHESSEHVEHEDEHDHEHHETVSAEPTEPMDVVIVGTIGGLANPWEETQPDFPFSDNRASFFLADPGAVAELEASGHVHAPGEECAFCAAHATDGSAMLAMVRFLDENGKVLPIATEQLFDVKERDTVVIRGSARIVAGGMMIVDATGIYVRR